jgi:LysM repeat protein
MALVKAYLTPVDPKGDKIECLFNPNQYTLNQANTIAEVAVPGLGVPILQYIAGKARTLKFDLFFDTYEAGSAVTAMTDKVYALLDRQGQTHVPPLVEFGWGQLKFKCVIDSIDGTFTMFLADGTPVRATLKMSLKEIVDVDVEVKSVANESADRVKSWTVKRGDTLAGIAAVEYGDPTQWRPIAEANGIDDPLSIQPGDVLVLPALTGAQA